MTLFNRRLSEKELEIANGEQEILNESTKLQKMKTKPRPKKQSRGPNSTQKAHPPASLP